MALQQARLGLCRTASRTRQTKMHEINAADPRRIKSEHSVSSEVIAKVAAGAKSPQLAYISNLLPEVLL